MAWEKGGGSPNKARKQWSTLSCQLINNGVFLENFLLNHRLEANVAMFERWRVINANVSVLIDTLI